MLSLLSFHHIKNFSIRFCILKNTIYFYLFSFQAFVALEKAYNQTHCLLYYKNRQIEGDTYDVEINLLQRTVSLIPV